MKMESQAVVQKSALDIVPAELWATIFDKMDDPSELQNCSKTCKDWQDILKMKRTTYLFGKVFPLLAKAGLTTNQDMLNCRLTSRMWKRGVDEYLQQYDHHAKVGRCTCCFEFDKVSIHYGNGNEELEEEDHPVSKEPWSICPHAMYVFKTLAELREFLASSNQYHSNSKDNPFVSRCIIIGNHELDFNMRTQMWTYCVDTFLPKLGSHVTCFSLSLTGFGSTFRLFTVAVGCLVRLPNLKSLCLEVGAYGQHELEMFYTYYSAEYANYGRMDEDSGPLTVMKLVNAPALLINLLLKWYTQIEKLELVVLRDDYEDYVYKHTKGCCHNSDCQLDWSKWSSYNLVELHLDVRNRKDFLNLQKLACSKLQKLYLVVTLSSLNDWKVIANIANQFGDSLENLTLEFGHSVDSECTKVPMDKLQFRLWNLKTLTVITGGKYFPKSFDFIRLMKSLRQLIVRRSNCRFVAGEEIDDGGKQNEIQFNGFENSLNESNIWNLMQNLESISIKSLLFDRNDPTGDKQPKVYFYQRDNCNTITATSTNFMRRVNKMLASCTDSAGPSGTGTRRVKEGKAISETNKPVGGRYQIWKSASALEIVSIGISVILLSISCYNFFKSS